MTHTINLLHTINNEVLEDIKDQFKDWAHSTEGYKDIMALDVWHGFTVHVEGLICHVDIHFDCDEVPELFIYPCDEVGYDYNKTTTQAYLKCSLTNEVKIDWAELQRLMPKSLAMYINEKMEVK